MQTVAFVPARCGSKSIPFKNIKSFCGRPLIYWVLKALEEVDEIDEVFVATDCDEIQEVVEGLEDITAKVYRRNPENAQDNSTTESVVLEFIEQQKLPEDTRFILVQATSPLTSGDDFRKALRVYSEQKADSLLSCVRIKKFLWNSDGTSLNYDYRARQRRQDIDGELMENGAFYISTVHNILKSKNRLSGKITIYEMPEYTAVEIDEDDDWLVGELLMKKYQLSEK